MESAEENVGRDSPSVEGLKEEAGLAWAVLEDVELEDSLEALSFLAVSKRLRVGPGALRLM